MHICIMSKTKIKSTKLMLHEIQLFLSPSLFPSMDKCFHRCSKLLSQKDCEK